MAHHYCKSYGTWGKELQIIQNYSTRIVVRVDTLARWTHPRDLRFLKAWRSSESLFRRALRSLGLDHPGSSAVV